MEDCARVRVREREREMGGHLLSPRGRSVFRSSSWFVDKTLLGVGHALKKAATALFTVSPPLVREQRMQQDRRR